MSLDAMEFLVVVTSALLLLGVIYEVASRWMKHVEKREQDRRDEWYKRRMW